MGKLTLAQRNNLLHVQRHGKAIPRSGPAAYRCRVNGWSEFVWRFGDGSVATVSEQTPSEANGWLDKVVGERLTEAGRTALEAPDA